MKLDVRTVITLRHPTNKNQILLLRRNSDKKLFPNLITGIGGKVELQEGEGEDLEKSLLREFTEETKIPLANIESVSLKLSTITNRAEQIVILLWFTGDLILLPTDLSCTEGVLEFFDLHNLPINEMVPTAREAIPFIFQSQNTVHAGAFPQSGTGLVTSAT